MPDLNEETDMRMKCDNCERPFAHNMGGVVVHHDGAIVAAVCPHCCEGVEVAKIVLKRSGDRFRYEQFLPAAMMKKTA